MNKKILIIYVIVSICILGIAIKVKSMHQHMWDELFLIEAKENEILEKQIDGEQKKYDFDYSWAEDTPQLIAHGMGGYKDTYYQTNSYEAFLSSYNEGYRIFEVDFELTEDDNYLVATHDKNSFKMHNEISENALFTKQMFDSTRYFGECTTLDYKQVINLLNEYPDVYFVTDTKYCDKETVQLEFSQIVWYAYTVNPEVLDRLIPQIYNEEMLEWIMNIHGFKSVIFTLYQTDWTVEGVADFCNKTGVQFVTVHKGWLENRPEIVGFWKNRGIVLGVHTINEVGEAEELFEQRVDYLYTDTIKPSSVLESD